MSKKVSTSIERFQKVVIRLEECFQTPVVTNRDIGGVVQHFEMAYELCWKTLKKVLEERGIEAPFPRDVFEKAFQGGLISDGQTWAKMMDDRNLSSHTYDEALAKALVGRIQKDYLPVLKILAFTLK